MGDKFTKLGTNSWGGLFKVQRHLLRQPCPTCPLPPLGTVCLQRSQRVQRSETGPFLCKDRSAGTEGTTISRAGPGPRRKIDIFDPRENHFSKISNQQLELVWKFHQPKKFTILKTKKSEGSEEVYKRQVSRYKSRQVEGQLPVENRFPGGGGDQTYGAPKMQKFLGSLMW